MWIPHTIPPVILRAYTPGDHRTDLEALKKQYEGRILRSEDPEWHIGVLPKGRVSLAQLCLEMIIDGYEYYVQLTKCRNYILQRAFHEKDNEGSICVDDPDSKLQENPQKTITSLQKCGGAASITKLFVSKEDNVTPSLECQKFPNVLDILTSLQRMVVIEELNVEEIPFHIAVETIQDEYYWERALASLFPDKFKTDSTWRKSYLKLYTESYIEQFNPREDDITHLIKVIQLVSAEVTILKIEQILPYCYGAEDELMAHVPIPEDDELGVGVAAEFDEGFSKAEEMMESAFRKQSMTMRQQSEVPESVTGTEGSEHQTAQDADGKLSISDILSSVRSNSLASGKDLSKSEKSEESDQHLEDEEEQIKLPSTSKSSHVDFNQILPLLHCLKEISLVYEVKNVGFEWDESFFKFTEEDCYNLAKALRNSPTVEVLEINRSHINGEQFNTLVMDGIVHMPRLKKINLSYNCIGDIGARAIGHLMNNGLNKTLKTIQLCRNKITDDGAKQLGESLKSNVHVLNIDLRLNFIESEGCQMIAEALESNQTLEHISLCGNRLDSSSCYFIGKMLCINDSLKEIDLSCNILNEKGGEYLYHAVKYNNNLRKINLRLTDIGNDLEYNIVRCVENIWDRDMSKDERKKSWALIGNTN